MVNKMFGYAVLDILDGVKALAAKSGLPPLDLRPDEKVGAGRTEFIRGKIKRFVIGTKELEENPDKLLGLGEAMIPIAGAFHEICGHGGQILKEFQKDTPLSRVLAANYVACKYSPYYYDGFVEGSDWYKQQPHEIAAQYACIRELRSYLVYANTGDFEEEKDAIEFADAAVMAYQKTRMKRGSALTGKGGMGACGGFDNILLDLNSRFYDCTIRHHEYDVVKKLEDPDCRSDFKYAIRQDAIFKYAALRGEDQDKPESVVRVATCMSGTRQDKRLAFAYLYLEKDDYENHDERYKKRVGKPIGSLPVFSSGWLTHDAAFGRAADQLEDEGGWPEVNRFDMGLRRLEPMLMDIETNRPLAEGEEDDGLDGP